MKNVLLMFVLIVGLCTIRTTQAQTRVGGFLGYGWEVNQPGIGGIAEVGIADRWSLSPSMLFYFPESNRFYTFSWFEFNLNMNYYFHAQGSVNVYGLGGLNYLNYKRRERFGDGRVVTAGETGVNLGLGLNFNAGKKLMPFTEMKFVLGEAEQMALFFGLKVKL
jgi:outer membrane immunogenic protein